MNSAHANTLRITTLKTKINQVFVDIKLAYMYWNIFQLIQVNLHDSIMSNKYPNVF